MTRFKHYGRYGRVVPGIGVVLALVLVASLLLAGCGSNAAPAPAPAPAAPPAGGVAVEIANFAFSPATVTVSVGTTVTWTNQDSVPHTATSRQPLFDSGNLAKGESFSFTFTQAGSYEYYCTIHPQMVGTVVVQ